MAAASPGRGAPAIRLFGKPARSGYRAAAMETLVRVSDLTRRFGRQVALSGLDLTLERGEVIRYGGAERT